MLPTALESEYYKKKISYAFLRSWYSQIVLFNATEVFLKWRLLAYVQYHSKVSYHHSQDQNFKILFSWDKTLKRQEFCIARRESHLASEAHLGRGLKNCKYSYTNIIYFLKENPKGQKWP